MRKPINILVTGSTGQMGKEFQEIALQNSQNYHWYFPSRPTMDLAEPESIHYFFEQHPIDYCVNCAAYTAVDKAEEESETVIAVNHIGANELAKACQKHGATLIHYSTDYVYHNSLNRPLLETDPTHPKGIYAKSKLDGEAAVLNTLDQNIIIRTSWVYSSYGHNFIKTILRLCQERSELRVVYDQIGTPTYAAEVVHATMQIIQFLHTQEYDWDRIKGIYNFSNEGVTSWYDMAVEIVNYTNATCHISPIESKDYPTSVERPFYSVLNKARIKAVFNIAIPHWRSSLLACLKKIEQSTTRT